MNDGDKDELQDEAAAPRPTARRRAMPRSNRAVKPPPPKPASKGPLAGGVVLVLAAVGGFLWMRWPGPVPPDEVAPIQSAVPASTAPVRTPDPDAARREEADQLALSIRKKLDEMADLMVTAPQKVKPPYRWKELPDAYRRLSLLIRGRSFETEFLLEHIRRFSVPYSRLASAVSKDPDIPDAPMILTIDQENSRAKSFDHSIRELAEQLHTQLGDKKQLSVVFEAYFLMLSGDTLKATARMNHLPPMTKELEAMQNAASTLASALLAYGHKKGGTQPIEVARKGLEFVKDGYTKDARLPEWEWGLLTVYATVPSLFHEDHGRNVAGADLVETGLLLLGRKGKKPPPGVDAELSRETTKVIRDAGKRGTEFLGNLAAAGTATPADLVAGLHAARYVIEVTDGGKDEAPAWYSVFINWLTSGQRSLERYRAQLAEPLATLDATLAMKQSAEQTGLFSACRARVAYLQGNLEAARRYVAIASAKAQAAGFKQKEESVVEALDRFAAELNRGTPAPSPHQ